MVQEATRPAPDNRMPHLPGLDGLRGLAVIGVLLFHGGFSWARGGFLGVSTFFTLSGFLITNLLVREWDRTHAIALARFWTRRFRRLLPAALVAIVGTGLLTWWLGTPEQLIDLRADMVAALAYVANWRFLASGTSYADLFAAPSPLQHFWSLAIEEQFYLFFPLLVMGVMKVGGRRLLTWVLVGLTAGSVLLEVVLGGDVDRVYYGTDTRAAELLIGALLAVWWSGRRSRGVPRDGRNHLDWLTLGGDVGGAVALVVVFACWALVPEDSTTLARGGFPLYALATAVIIFAATRPGLVTDALSFRPLRWAGLISYGLYLYHWPIFLVLDQDRIDWPLFPLFVLRMAVTVAVALASYHLLEMPIRKGTMLVTRRAALSAAGVGAVTVMATALLVTMSPPQSEVPYADAVIGQQEFTVGTAPSTTLPPTTATTEAPPGETTTTTILGDNADTVMVLGDSGTVDAQPAIEAAFYASGTTSVIDGAAPGFGLSEDAFQWREVWTEKIAQFNPDLVVVMMGGWDLKFLAENGPDAYAALVDEAVQILTAGGANVMWVSMLPGGNYPERTVDEVYAQLPTKYPGLVAFTDIAPALEAGTPGEYPRTMTTGDGEVIALRKKDDWHLCAEGAGRVADAINAATNAQGWSHRATFGWQLGEWRSSPVFDDPPGTCTP